MTTILNAEQRQALVEIFHDGPAFDRSVEPGNVHVQLTRLGYTARVGDWFGLTDTGWEMATDVVLDARVRQANVALALG